MITWTQFAQQQPALAAAGRAQLYQQLFELSVANCLLTLTQPDGTFPKGPTVWKA